MPRFPVLFVSHGSPDIAVRRTPAHRALVDLGTSLPKPSAIVVISAHWETAAPKVATGRAPATVYDFSPQFDRRLWEIDYRAPGADDVAERAAQLICEATGLPVGRDPDRGRDHGVWTPLHLMFPAHDIPITQVSIQPDRSPIQHFEIGRALSPLRDDGVLLIGSGAITHNLAAFRGQPVDAPEPPWVASFRGWMTEEIESNRVSDVLDYRSAAPHARDNHPDGADEHLLPLFSALGAAAGESGVRVHASVEHGVIGMDCFVWGQ
ncbi:MAG: DODA-type extradiol aromatic ring-opening family dioxygenase [Hyphomicrobiaceae bacterium]